MWRSDGDECASSSPDNRYADDTRLHRDFSDQLRRPLNATERAGGENLVIREPASVQQQEQATRSGGDRNWSARIKASIARLLEIDGICLDPDTSRKTVEKRKDQVQSVKERVDRIEAASEVAHSVYWDTLRDAHKSTSTGVKRIRMTPPLTELLAPMPTPPTASTSRQSRHEALDTLVMAAATEHPSEQTVPTQAKKSKRRVLHNIPLFVEGEAASRQPAAVHDPKLVKAVDKLSEKLTQLLDQLHATSDAAAAEPILAAAATIALEATQIRRCEQVAMTRMLEIEEHRGQIMQGLLEYAQRKKREMGGDSRTSVGSHTPDAHDSSEGSNSAVQFNEDPDN